MDIEKHCSKPCRSGTRESTATLAGVQLVRKALDRLGRPEVVDYVDIVDAFTPTAASGNPWHKDGFLKYLDLGTDITCGCVLRRVLAQCGYTESDLKDGKYVREIPMTDLGSLRRRLSRHRRSQGGRRGEGDPRPGDGDAAVRQAGEEPPTGGRRFRDPASGRGPRRRHDGGAAGDGRTRAGPPYRLRV